jgi:hypothetical protein
MSHECAALKLSLRDKHLTVHLPSRLRELLFFSTQCETFLRLYIPPPALTSLEDVCLLQWIAFHNGASFVFFECYWRNDVLRKALAALPWPCSHFHLPFFDKSQAISKQSDL